ncbi:MAG: uncharacterized protein QOI34_1652 [Verrucomicrobiota bacterium]
MSSLKASQVEVGSGVLLDGRLAIFHEAERWLAVADLHFGYELSQRVAGNLFPFWGMQSIQARLEELLHAYDPTHLILLGDLVHNRAGASSLGELLCRLEQLCEIVLISGNHDRQLDRDFDLVPFWRSNGFWFHHGHCSIDSGDAIQVIGHHHPAAAVRDRAGLRLRLPAFVQQDHCWIMPAFSPWAAGTEWSPTESDKVWLCSPQRILRMREMQV